MRAGILRAQGQATDADAALAAALEAAPEGSPAADAAAAAAYDLALRADERTGSGPARRSRRAPCGEGAGGNAWAREGGAGAVRAGGGVSEPDRRGRTDGAGGGAGAGRVALVVYDVLGREVARHAADYAAGRHEATLAVRALAPGLYVVRASTEGGDADVARFTVTR